MLDGPGRRAGGAWEGASHEKYDEAVTPLLGGLALAVGDDVVADGVLVVAQGLGAGDGSGAGA